MSTSPSSTEPSSPPTGVAQSSQSPSLLTSSPLYLFTFVIALAILCVMTISILGRSIFLRMYPRGGNDGRFGAVGVDALNGSDALLPKLDGIWISVSDLKPNELRWHDMKLVSAVVLSGTEETSQPPPPASNLSPQLPPHPYSFIASAPLFFSRQPQPHISSPHNPSTVTSELGSDYPALDSHINHASQDTESKLPSANDDRLRVAVLVSMPNPLASGQSSNESRPTGRENSDVRAFSDIHDLNFGIAELHSS